MPDRNAPAFPWGDDLGMSIRDYFAAHAPAEPQEWFTPSMPPMPRLSDDREIWDEKYARERYIQWPYAWADAVLAASEGK